MLPQRARTPLVVLALGASLAFAPPLAAQDAPFSPARYVPPPGYRTKEFTLVRSDGWFHVFYLRENLLPGAPTLLSFGHAISRDLYTWAEQDTILPVVPGTFEGSQVWAPSLHRVDGTWFLFYPGMRDEPAQGYRLRQSITYATSPDLYTWTRRTTPLFDNRIFPWAHVDTTSTIGSDCRDPFLWWDAIRGEWLLYVSTRPASGPQGMVVGIAGSSDLEHWSDRGQVPLTLPAVSFSDVAESPHVFSRDDSLLLILWTTDAGQSLTFGRSTDPVSGWNTSRRLRSMLGYSTVGWWGSEMLRDGDRWYFGTIHEDWIGFWDATWTAADTFRVAPPDSLQLLGARLIPDRAAAGDTVALEVVAVHATGRAVAVSLTRREGLASTPLLPADFALADSIVLTGDTTRVPCVVPSWLGSAAFLIDVAVASGSSVGDTLAYAGTESPDGGEGPGLEPPPPIRIARPANGVIRFVRPAGTGAGPAGGFVVEVRDVRGRRMWRGEGDGFTRSLDWRTGGGGGTARVPPGIYFARVEVAGHGRPARLKVAVLP
jgi:hypothetical protein